MKAESRGLSTRGEGDDDSPGWLGVALWASLIGTGLACQGTSPAPAGRSGDPAAQEGRGSSEQRGEDKGAAAAKAKPGASGTARTGGKLRVLESTPAIREDGYRWEELEFESETLSAFHKRPVTFKSALLLPPGYATSGTGEPVAESARGKAERLPVSYSIHGFGGNHRLSLLSEFGLISVPADSPAAPPRMIHVFLDASWETGHHVFANSANNGDWGDALTAEFIPALEAYLDQPSDREARFVTGHSSGGWTALWLQYAYPNTFGGSWPTAPDPVDFREFTGVNIYEDKNAFTDADGQEVQLVRMRGQWRQSLREFVASEMKSQPTSGQMASFDAVFSQRGPDGAPLRLFDRETGAIDASVAKSWEPYDIALGLRKDPDKIARGLAGRVHIFCGTMDTFRLNEALALLEDQLRQQSQLGPQGIEIVWAKDRDHFDLYQPEPRLYPDGLHLRVWREMHAAFERTHPTPAH